MHRSFTRILGGTFGEDEWDLSPNPSTTKGIIERCLALEPSLSRNVHDSSIGDPESLPIIKVNVGLRPSRKNGPRLEKETITVPFERKPFVPAGSNITRSLKKREVVVVHVYGIGSTGFQVSTQVQTWLFQKFDVCSRLVGGWQRMCSHWLRKPEGSLALNRNISCI
jgi:hypothetical protein